MTNSNIFDEIYKRGSWKSGTSLSGPGSEPENALSYVAFVDDIIQIYGINAILDIGHGDWKMWPKAFFDNKNYVGIDVVQTLNESMRNNYQRDNIRFLLLDAVADELPKSEIVLIKDVLMHLSNKDIDAILTKLTGYRLSIICTDVLRKLTLIDMLFLLRRNLSLGARASSLLRGENPFFKLPHLQNIDIESGGHRYLNLEKKPWNLKKYNLKIINTHDFFVLPPRIKQWRCISIKRIYLLESTI